MKMIVKILLCLLALSILLSIYLCISFFQQNKILAAQQIQQSVLDEARITASSKQLFQIFHVMNSTAGKSEVILAANEFPPTDPLLFSSNEHFLISTKMLEEVRDFNKSTDVIAAHCFRNQITNNTIAVLLQGDGKILIAHLNELSTPKKTQSKSPVFSDEEKKSISAEQLLKFYRVIYSDVSGDEIVLAAKDLPPSNRFLFSSNEYFLISTKMLEEVRDFNKSPDVIAAHCFRNYVTTEMTVVLLQYDGKILFTHAGGVNLLGNTESHSPEAGVSRNPAGVESPPEASVFQKQESGLPPPNRQNDNDEQGRGQSEAEKSGAGTGQ